MSVIFVLIGFSLFIALIFLFAFIWSVKEGQYDDEYTPSVRILFDSQTIENNENLTKNHNQKKINTKKTKHED